MNGWTLVTACALAVASASASTVTNLTVRSGKMGRDIPVTVVLPDAYDGKMRFPSSTIRARRSAFVSSLITSGTVMDILVM